MSLKNPAKCEVAVRDVNILRWKMGLGKAKTPRGVIMCNLMINIHDRRLCWGSLERDRWSGVKTGRAVERRQWRRMKQKVGEERRGLAWLCPFLHVLLQLLA